MRDAALEFGGRPETLRLVGYADADDVGDKQTRNSTNDFVFVFSNATVSWSSQHIKCVTLSSTESGYIAATKVTKEACRLCFLLAKFQLLDAGTPAILNVDYQLAIAAAECLGLKGNLKHMGRFYVWAQEDRVAVHPDNRATGSLPHKGVALPGLQLVLCRDRQSSSSRSRRWRRQCAAVCAMFFNMAGALCGRIEE
ncbi:unnamed protein product [Closterium sp. NIES-53]